MTMTATMTVQGLAYEHVEDLRTLVRGDWLRTNLLAPLRPGYAYLTVSKAFGHHTDRSGVLCYRHGRYVPDAERIVLLEPPRIMGSQVWRALDHPELGIPGTWCDGFDSGDERCGKSLLHKGDCRH
jgi:hypothetical protein